MKIRAYFNKNMLYSNRKIINLENEIFEDFEVKSFNGGNTIDCGIIFNMGATQQLPTYIKVIDGTFNNMQFFVSNAKFIRKNQWNLTLIRDIISESNLWKSERAYVKTGYAIDNFKYNRWKFNLNVIKKSQQILTDNLSLVMFFNQRKNTEGVDIDFSFSNILGKDENIEAEFASMEEFSTTVGTPNSTKIVGMKSAKFKIFTGVSSLQYTGSGSFSNPNVRILRFDMNNAINTDLNYFLGEGTYLNNQNTIWDPQQFTIDASLNSLRNSWRIADRLGIQIQDHQTLPSVGSSWLITGSFFNNSQLIQDKLSLFTKDENTDPLLTWDNKIVKIAGKLYKINLTTTVQSAEGLSNLTRNQIADQIMIAINSTRGTNFQVKNINTNSATNFRVFYDQVIATITLSEIQSENIVEVPIPTTYPIMDKIPCKALVINDLTKFNVDEWIQWCVGVMEQSPEVIDCQLLPFNLADNGAVANVTVGGDIVQNFSIKYLTQRDNSYNIPVSIPTTNRFIDKESQMIRLSSPSFGSSMDITPYLNDGITEIKVKLSAKPLGSIIYCQPNYSGIYGSNFEDKRGFIINEDFGISRLDNAWVNYKYQNRNFINSFNRQMESIELNNYYMREADRLALERSDTEAKALARQNTASEWGMFDQLFLGIPSLIGGSTHKSNQQYQDAVKLDTQMNEALRQDNIALQKELFNNNLGNIKAITPTISKLDTLDILNMYSIVLEIYGCTDVEENYILSYYDNNGENIGTISYFENYFGLVVSGKIIQSENYTQVELKELNKRLEGGIYTGITVGNILTGGEN